MTIKQNICKQKTLLKEKLLKKQNHQHKRDNISNNNNIISDNIFTCKGTNKKYYINQNFDCNSMNVIYLTSCTNCNEQYVGSALENPKVTSTPKRTDVELLVITQINVGTHRIFVPS